jgi:hypothetical protein
MTNQKKVCAPTSKAEHRQPKKTGLAGQLPNRCANIYGVSTRIEDVEPAIAEGVAEAIVAQATEK